MLNDMSYIIHTDFLKGILLYLHLIPKKMEAVNEPTQKIHDITIIRHHVPKQGIGTIKLS